MFPLRTILRNHYKTLAVFATGQFLIQLLNLIAGFLIIRWMPKEEFAKFTLAFSIQNTLGMLVEMGLSSALLAFIGEKINDDAHVSKYYHAVLYWRRNLFIIIFPISLIVFALLTMDKGWEIKTMGLLYISIPLTIYFQGFTSFYGVILQMKREISKIYFVQIFLSAVKIACVFAMFLTGLLYSWGYLMVNAALTFVNSLFFSHWVKSSLIVQPDDSHARRQIIDYIKPSIIGIFFSSFQSQIAILLISILGTSSEIADIGALGRLAQLFTFFSAFNTMIIIPRMAALPVDKILKRTIAVMSLLAIPLSVMIAIAWIFPQVFVFILGDKYQNLSSEFVWTIVIAAIGYLAGVLLSIASSKKWIYYWDSIAFVILFLVVNSIGLLYFDLSTVRNVQMLMLVQTVGFLIIQVAKIYYGLRFGPRVS